MPTYEEVLAETASWTHLTDEQKEVHARQVSRDHPGHRDPADPVPVHFSAAATVHTIEKHVPHPALLKSLDDIADATKALHSDVKAALAREPEVIATEVVVEKPVEIDRSIEREALQEIRETLQRMAITLDGFDATQTGYSTLLETQCKFESATATTTTVNDPELLSSIERMMDVTIALQEGVSSMNEALQVALQKEPRIVEVEKQVIAKVPDMPQGWTDSLNAATRRLNEAIDVFSAPALAPPVSFTGPTVPEISEAFEQSFRVAEQSAIRREQSLNWRDGVNLIIIILMIWIAFHLR